MYFLGHRAGNKFWQTDTDCGMNIQQVSQRGGEHRIVIKQVQENLLGSGLRPSNFYNVKITHTNLPPHNQYETHLMSTVSGVLGRWDLIGD